MAAYEQKTGGQLLAIPHNGNLSNGLMFDDVTFTTRSRSTVTMPSAGHDGSRSRGDPDEG